MSVINTVIQKAEHQSSANRRLIEAILADERYVFYGDLITAVIKARKMKLQDVATQIGISKDVFRNARTKKKNANRGIGLFEILRILIVLNLDGDLAKSILERCNYALPAFSAKDKILRAVLYTKHHTLDEREERLACIYLIEKHYFDTDFDLMTAIKNADFEDYYEKE